MDKKEAKSLMKAGKKISHRFFTDEEWITSDPTGVIYSDEKGIQFPAREFWNYRQGELWERGYYIYEPQRNKE